ncbi:hypothetical protein FKW77_003640 [Venturia effusa]|uniref:N-acetyltransferase domain-containing protein n=1 Tax=Venturia effusa TaxID=50376 RepID=A0A517L130_9PEZI|nr:hypothetical protein FKW77_003640 [Venturia effusa]
MCLDTNESSAASFATQAIGSSLIVRSASVTDLENMLDIGLSAMPMDPQWNWRFPYRLQFPEDTRRFTRQKYREFLEDKTGRWQVMVADIKLENDKAPVTVAMAIWDMGSINRRASQRRRRSKVDARPNRSDNSIRRDGDPKRMQAWTVITAKSKAEVFDGVFGSCQLHLQILATDPKYQGRGAGRALCDWGIQLAARVSMPLTVFASPMGYNLYHKIGFIPVVNVQIRVPGGDDGGVMLKAMTYIPQSVANAMKMEANTRRAVINK